MNEKVLLLAECIPSDIKNYQIMDSSLLSLQEIYPIVLDDRYHKYFVIMSNDATNMLQRLAKSAVFMQAAGGLVNNEHGKYLFIFRHGRWDLPKGKVEQGEKIREAALREVQEECGITVSSIEKPICETFHVYRMQEQLILKKTHWYQMQRIGQQQLTPQEEEGIAWARWIDESSLDEAIKNTYPSIIAVLQAAGLTINRKTSMIAQT